MISRRRATVSTALTNGANTLVVALQSIVLFPLFLRTIGKGLYGAWGGSGDVLLWMLAFDLGLPNLMGQRIAAAHGREDGATVGRWLSTGLVVLAFVSALLIGGAVVLSSWLPSLFTELSPSERSKLSQAFALAGVGAGLVMLNNGALVYARSVQRPGFLNAVMVVSAIANLVVTLFFLLNGAGLLAIAYGILARSVIQSLASVGFLAAEIRGGRLTDLRFDREIFGEAMRMMPATLVGGLAYAALNQSELLILNLTVGSVVTVTFLAMRRAAELVRALGDAVAFSSYSSFAHLVSSPERARAVGVLDEITDVRAILSVVLLAPFLAVNPSFVLVWSKGEIVPDSLLTVAIAAQTLVIGGAFLANFLFRAAGEIMKGSLLLAAEAVVRVSAMYGMSKALGPIGVPLGAIVTALPAWFLTERMLRGRLEAAPRPSASRWKILSARGAVLAVAGLAGLARPQSSWTYVVLVGLGTTALAFLVALACEPAMNRVRNRLRTSFTRSAA